jgi:hypothetical protein
VIIGIDNTAMTASLNIGGTLSAMRVNSVVVNTQGNNCEMRTQTAFSGLVNNDADDCKKRADASLAKPPCAPAKREVPGKVISVWQRPWLLRSEVPGILWREVLDTPESTASGPDNSWE